jgi:Ni,Fe-hydrogenase I cytochrome b subunit
VQHKEHSDHFWEEVKRKHIEKIEGVIHHVKMPFFFCECLHSSCMHTPVIEAQGDAAHMIVVIILLMT